MGISDDLGDGKVFINASFFPCGDILGYFHISSSEFGWRRRGKEFQARSWSGMLNCWQEVGMGHASVVLKPSSRALSQLPTGSDIPEYPLSNDLLLTFANVQNIQSSLNAKLLSGLFHFHATYRRNNA